jgi:hypothetical protein
MNMGMGMYPGMNMGMGMNAGMGMGMGMGFMPIPYGMFGTPSLSLNDAAALGMTRPGNAGLGIGGPSNTVFMNPVSTSMIYGNTAGMTPRQVGMTMLAGQALGIGSGQLSGVRPGPAGSTSGRAAAQPGSKPRGSASQPGGLAARYFHRSAPITRYPQSYYSRQNRYYPPITR